MRCLLLIGIVIVAPLSAEDTGYRIVHPDGTVEYTDQPEKGAESIRLPEIPTYTAPSEPPSPAIPSAPASEKNTVSSTQQQHEGYTLFTISSPQDQQTVWFDAAGMDVSLQLKPGLAKGDMVVIRLDGQVVAAGTATSYKIKDVYRGTHTLSAVITDGRESIIRETGPITFTMRQHSLLHPKPEERN